MNKIANFPDLKGLEQEYNTSPEFRKLIDFIVDTTPEGEEFVVLDDLDNYSECRVNFKLMKHLRRVVRLFKERQ